MLSKSDEDILNERLRNWGRWCAVKKHLSCNTIYRMMMLYGERDPNHLPDPQEPPAQIDGTDAVLVNRAWQQLPESPLRYKIAKWVLVAQYAYPHMSLDRACRILKIRHKEYEELLKIAKYMILNRLMQHASKFLQQDIN